MHERRQGWRPYQRSNPVVGCQLDFAYLPKDARSVHLKVVRIERSGRLAIRLVASIVCAAKFPDASHHPFETSGGLCPNVSRV